MAPKLRLESKRFFLTYPRYGDSTRLLNRLRSEPNIQCYIVAHEYHNDGNPHLHAYVELSNRLRITDPRYWDVETSHPNVQVVRSKSAVIEYACKDDEFIAEKNIGGQFEKWDIKLKRFWKDAIAKCTTKAEFLHFCKEHFTREYVLQYSAIESFATIHFGRRNYTPRYTTFKPDAVLCMWAFLYLLQPTDRPRSLILVGKSRLGKTEWARSLGVHWYMGGMFNLDCFWEDATYGIFDDIPVEFFKAQYKQFLGGQLEFVSTDKYRKKVALKWGKPCIFLCNPPEYLKMYEHWDMDWIKANCEIVEIDNKMY